MIEVRPLKFRGLLFGVYFFAIVQRKYIRKCKSMGNLYCHKSMKKQEKKICVEKEDCKAGKLRGAYGK